MNAYAERMLPYAQQASGGTGLPVTLILAQWAHETGWGGSTLAREHNNHGGINYTSNADYEADGRHAGYRTVEAFVRDYIRVINLPFYAHIRRAAAAGAPPQELALLFDVADEEGRKYAEDPWYGSKLVSVLGSIQVTGGEPLTVQLPAGVTAPKDSRFAYAAALAVGLVALLWIRD